MLNKIQFRILLFFVAVGIIPFAVTMYWEYRNTNAVLIQRTYERLSVIRETKKKDLENCFYQMRNEIAYFAQNILLNQAMNDFKEAFINIKAEEVPPDFAEKLKSYYREELIDKLKQYTKDSIDITDVFPKNHRSILLQSLYLMGNKTPFKSLPYHLIHQKYHTQLSNYLKIIGYYDIMLVEDESGYIIYSIRKETDFATSLLSDKHANSHLGRLYRKVRQQGIKYQASMCDFEPYLPSFLAPVAFLAAPIFEGDIKIGTVIFQIPIEKLDAITTNNRIWRERGFGETGESYIVGRDCRMRTNSRFIIESPNQFFAEMEMLKTAKPELERMKLYKSTILHPITCNDAIIKAIGNQSGQILTEDYRKRKVLSSYAPLNIPDVNWVLLAEIDQEEALAILKAFGWRSFRIITLVSILIIAVSLYLAKSISNPILKLVAGTYELGKGNLNVKVEVKNKNEIGILANSFNQTVASLKEKRDEIVKKQIQIESQMEEISMQAEKLKQVNEEITQLNDYLEEKVRERTKTLEEQNKKLVDYAFFNAHRLRAPVASILGLLNLMKDTTNEQEKQEYVYHLEKATKNLDEVVYEIQQIIEEAEFNME